MATIIKHRRTQIVTLEKGEEMAKYCHPGNMVIVEDERGWWLHFIDEKGQSTTYDEPYAVHIKAVHAAKAAAEFAGE